MYSPVIEFRCLLLRLAMRSNAGMANRQGDASQLILCLGKYAFLYLQVEKSCILPPNIKTSFSQFSNNTIITSLNFSNRMTIVADTECVLFEVNSWNLVCNLHERQCYVLIFIFVLVVTEEQEVETWELSTKGMLCTQIRHHPCSVWL